MGHPDLDDANCTVKPVFMGHPDLDDANCTVKPVLRGHYNLFEQTNSHQIIFKEEETPDMYCRETFSGISTRALMTAFNAE